jgi:hypothetical protein
MSDVRTSLRRRSNTPGPSEAAYLGLSYAALGNQLPRMRGKGWREAIIHTGQAK